MKKTALSHLQLGMGATVIGAILGSSALAQDAGVWELQSDEASRAEAAAAGEKMGAKDGAPFAVPTGKKIGVIMLSAQSSSSQRILRPIEKISADFGFEVFTCDPNFDAQKVAQCATSMAAQGADAVFTISTSPGQMGSALSDSTAQGAKWFATVSGTEPSPHLIPYSNPGDAAAQLSAEWLLAEATKRKGPDAELKFAILTAPTVGLANLVAEQQVLKLAEADNKFEVVINHNLDLSNIVQDTISTTTQALQQHQDLAGYWTVCDLCVPLMSQAVVATGMTDADRPIISGDYTTPQSVALLREGKIDMLMDFPFEASVYVAFDQLLGHWSQGTEVASEASVFTEGYPLTFMQPYLLTKENVGSEGNIPVYGADFESFFAAKWKQEYGV